MKPIPNYEGYYSITEDGRVFSHSRPKGSIGRLGKNGFLTPRTDDEGYLRLTLNRPGHRRTFTINRLMALTFLDADFADHKDRNTANNHLTNLRPCSFAQNRAHSKRNSNNTSGYKGVDWNKKNGQWRARIKVGNKRYTLGHFPSREEAARAYDDGAKKHFGEFVVLNFPDA